MRLHSGNEYINPAIKTQKSICTTAILFKVCKVTSLKSDQAVKISIMTHFNLLLGCIFNIDWKYASSGNKTCLISIFLNIWPNRLQTLAEQKCYGYKVNINMHSTFLVLLTAMQQAYLPSEIALEITRNVCTLICCACALTSLPGGRETKHIMANVPIF